MSHKWKRTHQEYLLKIANSGNYKRKSTRKHMVNLFSNILGKPGKPKICAVDRPKRIWSKESWSQIENMSNSSSSSQFQVIVFTPNHSPIRAANWLCICEQCKLDYGSYDLFKLYELSVTKLKETTVRSKTTSDSSCSQETAKEFLLPGSICAIAADTKSTDMIWFVYIVDVEEVFHEKLDSYGHAITPGHMFVRARYLERHWGHQEREKF